jgi:hypothetical protein
MRKPNAILHMTGYGLVYGLLLAMLYIWGYLILIETGDFGSMGATLGVIGFVGYFAFLFGALPGGIMGFIEGWLLAFLTRDLQPPMSQEKYTSTRNLSLGIIGGLTFLGMTSLLTLLFGLPSLNDVFFWLIFTILPGLVAGGAAMYAVNRYMLKLRAWANIGKAKNDYKAKNQLADSDTESETPLATEDEAQVNQLRQG